jgi:hypothetical protein
MISHRKGIDSRPKTDMAPSTEMVIMYLHHPRHNQDNQITEDGQSNGKTASIGAVTEPGKEENNR